jgi:hypothetical protein
VLDGYLWALAVTNRHHNHAQFAHLDDDDPISEYPSKKRRTIDVKSEIKAGRAANIPPRAILTSLTQKYPGIKITSRNIYNEMTYLRQRQLNGRLPIEALLEWLQSPTTWVFDYKIDFEGWISHLFFGHKKAIKLFQTIQISYSPTARTRPIGIECRYFISLV